MQIEGSPKIGFTLTYYQVLDMAVQPCRVWWLYSYRKVRKLLISVSSLSVFSEESQGEGGTDDEDDVDYDSDFKNSASASGDLSSLASKQASFKKSSWRQASKSFC